LVDRTIPIEVDGHKWNTKVWSVKDRRAFLKMVDGPWQSLIGEKGLDAGIKFVSEQISVPIKEIEDWDAILLDKVMSAIMKANRGPLEQPRSI